MRGWVVGAGVFLLACGSPSDVQQDVHLKAWGPYPFYAINAGGAIHNVDLLRELRAGRLDEAIEMVEDRLDYQVAGLWLEPEPDPALKRRYLSALRYVQAYRAEFPRTPTDENLRDLSAKAFKQLEPSP